MRFHIGPVPEDTDFDPDPSLWSPIREPKPWLLILIAAPIGIVLTAAVAGLWIIATPLETISVRLSLFGFLLYIGGLAIVHELIHALAHPGFGFTSRSIIGVWPSHLAFYAGYMGETSKGRFLTIFLAPLLVISFLPLVIGAVTQHAFVELAGISVLNALFSCGDVVGAFLVATQIPGRAMTRNRGWKTYWRMAASKDEEEAPEKPANADP